MIEFNKPYYPKAGKANINETFEKGTLFRGTYYHACMGFFRRQFHFKHVIPTSSCTTALELVARLLDIKPGDEVIVPSYTYVSTANAFASFGASIIMADSEDNHPNISADGLEKLISAKTRAIVLVHYGGFSCNMKKVRELVKDKDIVLIEDAAHAIGCKSGDAYLGSFGDFSTFSFHETKNVSCGQGGMLVINNEAYLERAMLLKENGTNRDNFIKGATHEYTWLDVGSTYNLPELNCSVLYAGLLETKTINEKRRQLWLSYYNGLSSCLEPWQLPHKSFIEESNGHIFYLLTGSEEERRQLIEYLMAQGIKAVFHYLALHLTPYYKANYGDRDLPNAARFSRCLLRLPMYFELDATTQDYIITAVLDFYKKYSGVYRNKVVKLAFLNLLSGLYLCYG
jgi:dTDP-4-amino-4,6-dideoxygalactose transaminase